ncbi:MAG TPA: alpha/beta hydrolase [Crenalkalicoccus sp.]|jgi:pimeloyl-ACP methyl ester carboxylesterase|nr:alpha/beta hydrolase [Crenalkalicoccus sp.]
MPRRVPVPALLALAGALLCGAASALAQGAEEAYRAAFSTERLGKPPPSAALGTEFVYGYRGAVPHAAFAVARDAEGRSSWGWSNGLATPEAAEEVALASCRKGASPAQGECRIIARDGAVQGAAPIAAEAGILGPFRRSPLHLWRGPQAARGVLVWGHGYAGPDRDLRNARTPGLAAVLNDAGYDVLRFDRPPGDDAIFASLPRLVEALPALRAAGYRRIVLGGQSRGGWQALMAAAAAPELVDAVIATAPSAHGEAQRPNNLGAALEDFRRLLAGLPEKGPRVAVALFEGDDFDPDPERRALAVETLARDRAAPLLALWPASSTEIRGHAAAGDWRFTRFFAACLLTLVQGPEAAAPRGLRRAPCGGG